MRCSCSSQETAKGQAIIMNALAGKAALITGGGSGIGLALARAFIQEGGRVAITGRDGAKLRQAAESLRAEDRLIFFTADVGQPEQVQAVVDQVLARFQAIDIL